MRSVECGCPYGKDHDKDSVMCELPYWEEIFLNKDAVWRVVNKWCKARNMSDEETAEVWGNEAFFPRLEIGKPDENRER